jgi:hypothetical protein
MAKKSLHIGINDYPYADNDLNGCVNDANAWASLLRDKYGFAAADVHVLTDAQATKKNSIAGIKQLLAGAKAHDVLVYTNSSHGTYTPDKDGDEGNAYDEAICPHDIQDSLIIDDELRELFSAVPKGVHLTVISDSCFSGTVTRAVMHTPDDRRVRFLNPALRGDPVVANPFKIGAGRSKYPQSSMKEVLLSGASDKEYSYDANIGGTYHGAMTYYAIKAIEQAKYKLTYTELHKSLLKLIDEGGYPQHPQLEGASDNKGRQIFA